MKKLVGVLLIVVLSALYGCGNRQTVKVGPKKDVPVHVNYSDNSGDSYESAIKITGVKKQSEGLEAEYAFLSSKHGVKNKDWKIVGQTVFREKDKFYDVIEISLGTESDRRIYYFDVTSFPWKKK
ncbi:MAG: hypothetical protein GX640_20740 [Fibrobacter sp.]|nr:hypothetical protein [Fibrobacter sp.]